MMRWGDRHGGDSKKSGGKREKELETEREGSKGEENWIAVPISFSQVPTCFIII